MTVFIVGVVCLIAGLIVGTLYGRKAEAAAQAEKAKAVAEFNKIKSVL